MNTPNRLSVLLSLSLAVTPAASHAFDLESPQLQPGITINMAQVNSAMGCQGMNESPALLWSDPPAGTQSFAVTMYDPDAPTGSGWWHWVVFDIPAETDHLTANSSGTLPEPIVESLTDFGRPGYGGPCPPEGAEAHHYEIRVHALDVPSLGLDASAMPALAGYMIHAHSLGSASIMALYGR